MDARINDSPGLKYSHWELKGVPIRIEVGRNEVSGRKAMLVYRYSGKKESVDVAEGGAGFADAVATKLTAVQGDMLAKATELRNNKLRVVSACGREAGSEIACEVVSKNWRRIF